MNKMSKHFTEESVSNGLTLYCAAKKMEMTAQQFIGSKNLRGGFGYANDRSICQMLRNVNQMTNHEHERNIVVLANFAVNAVVKLGQWSQIPGNLWGERKTRSDFTQEKRHRGEELLSDMEHPIFVLLRSLTTSIAEAEINDYIVEIAYYFQQINEKILDYETKADEE